MLYPVLGQTSHRHEHSAGEAAVILTVTPWCEISAKSLAVHAQGMGRSLMRVWVVCQFAIG